MHWIGEKRSERVPLADALLFVAPEQLVELRLLLVLGQHLKTVVMVADVLLVDAEHRKQHVEKVSSKETSFAYSRVLRLVVDYRFNALILHNLGL